MKSKLFGLMLLATLAVPSFAGENSGVRGGGHVVEVNGELELVDIVSNATCDWVSGRDLMSQHPVVQEILKKLEKLDWYLSLELKRELEYISWCMTGNLYSVPANDDDSFVQQLSKGVQQAAFRYNENAYIDQEKFNRLSPSSQAYLLFHEMLHSYLPMNLEMRIFKLQSLISTIRKVHLGQITTREALHLNLSKSEMQFPFSVEKLAPFKKSLSFLLSSLDERVEAILESEAPEALIHPRIIDSEQFLASWDKKLISNPDALFRSAVEEIFKSQDAQQIKVLLERQQYQRLNPAAIGITIFQELSTEIKRLILSSKDYSRITSDAQKFLEEIRFTLVDGRILGDRNLQLLSGSCKEQKPIYTSSLSTNVSGCELPAQIQAISDLMVALAESGMDAELRELFESNELVLALKLTKQLQNLAELRPLISRERSVAVDVVTKIQSSMIKRLKDNVLSRLTNPSPTIEQIFNKF